MGKKSKSKKIKRSERIEAHVQAQLKAMDSAKEKASNLTDDQKDEILDTLLCELTTVVSNRIRLTEEVFDRIVPIKTTLELEDKRTLTIELK